MPADELIMCLLCKYSMHDMHKPSMYTMHVHVQAANKERLAKDAAAAAKAEQTRAADKVTVAVLLMCSNPYFHRLCCLLARVVTC